MTKKYDLFDIEFERNGVKCLATIVVKTGFIMFSGSKELEYLDERNPLYEKLSFALAKTLRNAGHVGLSNMIERFTMNIKMNKVFD